MWKIFWKSSIVKELLSFDFWISRHFVAIFRNILSTFQDALSPKATMRIKIGHIKGESSGGLNSSELDIEGLKAAQRTN